MEGLIKTFRSIVLTVQIVPFIYSALYIFSLLISISGNETAQTICDLLFYVSPFFAGVHLLYSKILHLCTWHRTACFLPIIPQGFSFLDYFVFDWENVQAILLNVLFISLFATLLISAHNTFFYDRRKKISRRNP